MQSVSSRIWTRIAVFISYGDNDYTTGNGIEGVLRIPQSPSITGTSPSDCLVSSRILVGGLTPLGNQKVMVPYFFESYNK